MANHVFVKRSRANNALVAAICALAITALTAPICTVVEAKSAARGTSGGNTHVRGHTTKRGTYVPPHVKTKPDRTQRNNYSSRGNVNPYTGKRGSKAAKR